MLNVIVVTPERTIFEGRANSVIFPGEQGVFEILPSHKPLLSRLTEGEVVVDDRSMFIKRGIVKVEYDAVAVVVEED